MSNRYAVVSSGVVSNVILWDGESGEVDPRPEPIDGEPWVPFSQSVGGDLVNLPDDSPVGVGWLYDGESFEEPAQ